MGNKMKIKRNVAVKSKLTESLQKKMIDEYQEVAKRLDGDIAMLEKKMKEVLPELGKTNPSQAVVFRQQLSLEKEQIEKNKETVLSRAREVAKMELGTEVVQGTIESIVEVKVGDNLEEILKAEIVVEDGKILEFR